MERLEMVLEGGELNARALASLQFFEKGWGKVVLRVEDELE